MPDVLDTLVGRLPSDVQALLRRRVASMLREIDYLAATASPLLPPVPPSREALRVICALNSFYQIVIAPLRAASPRWAPLKQPILYGTKLRFDEAWRRDTRGATGAFFRMTRRLGLSLPVLSAAHGRDLLIRLKREQDDELQP